MNAGRSFAIWLGLLAVVGAEVAAAHFSFGIQVVPFVGLALAAIICFTFMDLSGAPALAKIFAMAGLFWLCVMMGLGSLDSATRHDILVPAQTER